MRMKVRECLRFIWVKLLSTSALGLEKTMRGMRLFFLMRLGYEISHIKLKSMSTAKLLRKQSREMAQR